MEEFEALTNDRGLYKKVLKAGFGPTPEEENEIVFSYVGILEDGKVVDKQSNAKIELNSEDIIKGLKKGIMSMTKGEKSIFVMRYDYAYGNKQLGIVPPFSSIIFQVDLHSFS